MVIVYDKLVGRNTPLLKEGGNTYLSPEMKAPTTNRSPPAVMAPVGSWKVSRYCRHRKAALTETFTCRQQIMP